VRRHPKLHLAGYYAVVAPTAHNRVEAHCHVARISEQKAVGWALHKPAGSAKILICT
jgi:hypothetical protein